MRRYAATETLSSIWHVALDQVLVRRKTHLTKDGLPHSDQRASRHAQAL